MEPVILVVVEDGAAGRSMLAELGRYASDYRVEAVTGGDEALARLRNLRAAGDAIAMVLAELAVRPADGLSCSLGCAVWRDRQARAAARVGPAAGPDSCCTSRRTGPTMKRASGARGNSPENVEAALAEDRRADAIKLFMAASGMPPEMVEGMSGDPKMHVVAPTMLYDFEVMRDSTRGGTIPEDLVRAVSIPTLVIAGGASPDFFRDTAGRIAEVLRNGRHTVLEGQDHGASADVVAPVVAEFFTTWSPAAR